VVMPLTWLLNTLMLLELLKTKHAAKKRNLLPTR